MKKVVLFLALLLVVIAGGIFVAKNTAREDATSNGRIAVVSSFYIPAHIAEQVGGEFANVTNLAPEGVEPHDYEPTPSDLARIYSADLFLFHGAGIDSWAQNVAVEAAKQGVAVVKMTESFELDRREEETEKDGVEAGTDDEDGRGEFDPHVWVDPVRMQTMVEVVADALVAADPAHRDAYRREADYYIRTLSALHGLYENGLASCQNRDIIVSHDAFHYLGERYNITIHAIAGISPDEEPSSRRIAELAGLANTLGITTIFFETLVSTKLSETLANEIGATTAVLNPVEGLTSEEKAAGETYVRIMETNLEHLITAMECTSSGEASHPRLQ